MDRARVPLNIFRRAAGEIAPSTASTVEDEVKAAASKRPDNRSRRTGRGGARGVVRYTGQRVTVDVLVYEATGSNGGRVSNPPDRLARKTVTLDGGAAGFDET